MHVFTFCNSPFRDYFASVLERNTSQGLVIFYCFYSLFAARVYRKFLVTSLLRFFCRNTVTNKNKAANKDKTTTIGNSGTVGIGNFGDLDVEEDLTVK